MSWPSDAASANGRSPLLDVFLAHDAGEAGRVAQVAIEGLFQIDLVGLNDLQPAQVADQLAQIVDG